MVALIAALAGLDEHHGSAEKVPIGAGEGHAGCARATGGAATAIPAHPAVVGPVQASAPAAGVGQAVWFGGLVRTRALPSFLHRDGHRAAGPNVAQACLLDQLTPSVVIGDARRNAHPTGPGTLGPGGDLNHTLIPQLTPDGQVLISMWFVPFASNFQQLIAQGAFLLVGFVRVQLPVRFGIRLSVRIARVGYEGVGSVSRRQGSAVRWGHNSGSLMAVDAETALAWHLH